MTFSVQELEGLRTPLLAFCYHMLGSPFDAEDAVQDAFERALRSREAFDPAKASLSTWCHRIAHNICVDRIRTTKRRPLPHDLSAPGLEIGAPLVPAPEVPWLMPAPTGWLLDTGPTEAAERRHDVRIAVTAMLQQLPARQRGVLLLRDVFGYSAAETAAMLDMTVAGVNSALQRARASIGPVSPHDREVSRALVERYALAIERADVAALAALVCDDVALEMPPVPGWLRGRDHYSTFMNHLFSWRGTSWRTRIVSANHQPALLLFLGTGPHAIPHTVHLFDGDSAQIDRILVYQEPRLFSLLEV